MFGMNRIAIPISLCCRQVKHYIIGLGLNFGYNDLFYIHFMTTKNNMCMGLLIMFPSMSMMVQLTTEQRVFVVTEYTRTQNLRIVQQSFQARYPGRDPPARSTILRNVRKYHATGTSLNRNKGHSGRRRTGRSEENIEAVITHLQQNPRNVSAQEKWTATSACNIQSHHTA